MNKTSMCSLVLVFALTAASAGALDGLVVGKVKFLGTPPAPKSVPVTRDADTCGRQSVPGEQLLADKEGGLQNVVITLSGAPGKQAPGVEAVLDQRGCVYSPHVQVVPTGSTLVLQNGDELLHNVHAYLGDKTLFNLGMPFQGQKLPRKLNEPGVVSVKCDVHDWMHAYVVVTDSPSFAVSDETGAFTLSGVAAGSYTLRAWHELLGTVEKPIEVPASGEVQVTIELGPK